MARSCVKSEFQLSYPHTAQVTGYVAHLIGNRPIAASF